MNLEHKTLLTVSTLAVLIAVRASSAEILTNGNFESFSSGNPTSWTYTQGDGPATLESSASVSPFTDVYPFSTRSVLLTEGSDTNFTPNLRQSFTPQTGSVLFSFEFRLSSLAGDPWLCVPANSANFSLNNLRIGGASGNFALSDGSGFPDILALSTGTWYQVSMTFNFAASSYSGSITPFGGGPSTWSNRSFLTASLATPNVASVSFGDLSSMVANGPIAIDNASIVPEPPTFALLALAGGVTLVMRRFSGWIKA